MKGDFILEVVNGNEPVDQAVIKAGNIQQILKLLKPEPAEAIELEAIADIEEQQMLVINNLPRHRCLATSEQAFWNIARVAGFDSEDRLKLYVDTVEEIFNRLADVAYGTPASRLNIPGTRWLLPPLYLFASSCIMRALTPCIPDDKWIQLVLTSKQSWVRCLAQYIGFLKLSYKRFDHETTFFKQ